MNDVLISVIVPVYNVEQYLNKCIQSILQQTYHNLEIILIDDGSTDSCPQICDEWTGKDMRIKVIHKENGGLSDARNAGIKCVSGDLVAFVDSDDWIEPELYERLKASLETNGCDIAACTVEMNWDNGNKCLLTVQMNEVLNREEAQLALLKESLLKHPVWYKLYRREVMQDVVFEIGKWHEDVFWSYQVIGNASRISLIDYIGYHYTQRSDSIMGKGYSPKRLDVMEAYEQRYRYILKNYPELESKTRVYLFLNCIYHGQMVLKYLYGNEQRECFNYLKALTRKYYVRRTEYSDMKSTHRLWIDLARISLMLACRLKNLLGVGV